MNNQQTAEHSNKGTDKKKKFKFIPSISEFYDRLRFHQWSFEQDNFKDYMEAMGKEIFMYELAVAAGPLYVKAFVNKRIEFISNLVSAARREEYNKYSETLLEAYITGDDEFDEFTAKVRCHDWFYDFSDNGNVCRRGSEAEQWLIAKAKEKGGIYQKYYDRYAQKRKEAISKSK